VGTDTFPNRGQGPHRASYKQPYRVYLSRLLGWLQLASTSVCEGLHRRAEAVRPSHELRPSRGEGG